MYNKLIIKYFLLDENSNSSLVGDANHFSKNSNHFSEDSNHFTLKIPTLDSYFLYRVSDCIGRARFFTCSTVYFHDLPRNGDFHWESVLARVPTSRTTLMRSLKMQRSATTTALAREAQHVGE